LGPFWLNKLFFPSKLLLLSLLMQNNMQQYAAICSNMQQYAAICSNMQQYAAICSNMQQYAAICI